MSGCRLKPVCLILLTGCLLIQAGSVAAQKKNRYQLTENAQKQLTAVQQLMGEDKYQEALTILRKLLPSTKGHHYDTAVTYQTLGYVYSGLDKSKESVQAFNKAIQIGALPKSIVRELYFTIAQILIQQEAYEQGLKYLSRWFRLEKDPPAHGHFLAATAYYQLKNYKQMIYQIRNAIAKRRNAPASWYELLLAGYYETNKLPKAAALMEKMLELFPNRDEYWTQLAGIYLGLKQEKKALAIMELAYAKGALNKNDQILQLAKTYLYLGMPYKAASLVSTELEKKRIDKNRNTLKLLADSWLLAQERDKAIETLAEAAETYGGAALYYRLGQLYVDGEDWKKAVAALNKATSEPTFKNIADTYLLLGIAEYRNKDDANSYKALNKALGFEKTKKQAQQWLAQIKD
ncbi:MAG: tetratricopeptide repeat protein [Gammaproteobacteria bacterium]